MVKSKFLNTKLIKKLRKLRTDVTSNTKITILKPYVSHLVPSKAEQPKKIEKK